MIEEPEKKKRAWFTRHENAPWYLHLLWAVMGIFVLLFIMAALGWGGVQYGYIEVYPTPDGRCRVVVALIDAVAADDMLRGCMETKFAECRIVIGGKACQKWLEAGATQAEQETAPQPDDDAER